MTWELSTTNVEKSQVWFAPAAPGFCHAPKLLKNESPGCAAELANLPALEQFVAQRVFFDDDLLSSVCQNARLAGIQIGHGEVSKQAITILEQCHSLNRISISQCPKFPYGYQDELAARCSHAKYVAVGRK